MRGATGELSADRVVAQLGRLLKLIGLLEDRGLRRDRVVADRSAWAFTQLGLGSVVARLAPLEPRGGADWDLLGRVPTMVLGGFRHVQERQGLPPGWDEAAAEAGAGAANGAGVTSDEALVLRVVVDDRITDFLEVTQQHAAGLRAAAKTQRHSLGSVVGTLASANTRRRTAGLWTDADDRRVGIRLTPELAADIGRFLPARVQISGELARNSAGQVLSVRAEKISRVVRSQLRLVDSFGTASGHLDGLNPSEYLDAAGGWS